MHSYMPYAWIGAPSFLCHWDRKAWRSADVLPVKLPSAATGAVLKKTYKLLVINTKTPQTNSEIKIQNKNFL